jgi:hypothetical protein
MKLFGMIAEIQKAVDKACHGKRRMEIGEFGWNGSDALPPNAGFNGLLFPDDEEDCHFDLVETWQTKNVFRNEIPDKDGKVLIDVYAYYPDSERERRDGEYSGDLDTNVYVLIDAVNRKVISAKTVRDTYADEGKTEQDVVSDFIDEHKLVD